MLGLWFIVPEQSPNWSKVLQSSEMFIGLDRLNPILNMTKSSWDWQFRAGPICVSYQLQRIYRKRAM
jgi:hypothetical protein